MFSAVTTAKESRGVFLTPKHRHVHFVDQAMTQLVRHHEQRISSDEFHELSFGLWRQLLQTRHGVESLDRLVDPRGDLGFLLRQLRGCRRHVDQEG